MNLEHDNSKTKKIKFYPKPTNTGVKKILITIPLTLEIMQERIMKS